MTSDTFREMLDEMHKWESAINDKKSADYACDADTLSNFKKQASICKVLELPDEPWAEAIRLVIVKLIRFCNLAKKKEEPKNEARLDTIGDGRQYLLLAEACMKDEL